MLDEESAFHSIIIRVMVPAKDMVNVVAAADQLSIAILEIVPCQKREDVIILELFMNSSFNLYALGKLVGFMEITNNQQYDN